VLTRLPLLVAVLLATATVAVRGASQAPSAAPAAATATDKARPLDEVTVTGSRASLAARVSKFVEQIAALENAEGAPVWKVPVCPLVFGLTIEHAAQIEGRLANIARAARVPLDDDHCYPPNLFIVVTEDPKQLLQAWNNRSPTRMQVFGDATDDLFAGAPQSVIDDFIATPRPVRVWYYTHKQDAWGQPMSLSLSPYEPPEVHTEASHILTNNVVYEFFRVFVIADATRLRELTIAQFADYVSMVGLAKLEAGARLGDAPTILRVFGESPQTAPAGLTDWDQAFLKSLYATEQRSKLQRRQIARAMLREIGH